MADPRTPPTPFSANPARPPRPERRDALAGAAAALAAVGLGGCAQTPGAPAGTPGTAPPLPADAQARLRDEADAAERAFAKTMADRDLAAFTRAIAPDAVFLNGGRPLRGREAIAAHWKRFFEPAVAPFSWHPDGVEVLATGQLAMTVGPVLDPKGATFARFYSVWRREAPGVWSVVFDNGYALPACTPPRA